MAPDTGTAAAAATAIDEAYEFSAPRFFDFINEETEEAVRAAESWFEAACSHAPSPFNPRIKESRAEVKVPVLCDFADAEEPAPKEEAVEGVATGGIADQAANFDGNAQGKKDPSFGSVLEAPAETCADSGSQQQEESAACSEAMSESPPTDAMSESPPAEEGEKESPDSFKFLPSKDAVVKSDGGSSTPKMQRAPPVKLAPAVPTGGISVVKAVACTPKAQAIASKAPMTSSKSVRSVIKGARDLGAGKAATAATEVAQENQAVKRQKLDDGRTRQILDVKTRVLHHKGRDGLAGSTDLTQSSMRRSHDAHSAKEVTSYVSAAELVKKFESGTRGLDILHNSSHEDAAASRPKLMLTRPKEPQFQTANRVRAVRVKSSTELEEEMLAKIPKFRARPFNKKIAEAPAFPPLPRKPAQAPKFNEFHLKTMERATRHADSCSEASSVGTVRNHNKPLKLTEPKPPQLHTAMRARPPSVKSSQELELEELEKAPKFKAKPLNKKILESKGEIGVFAHPKPQATAPKEFHFSTDDRLGPPAVADLFDKLSLYSESSSQHDRNMPRVTTPNPFNLHTEERGQLKERQLAAQLLQKQMEEEKARVHKANPYPYTTDYPVVPPKPEPKPCTRPEGFQLESLVRHELEQQRLMEERARMEMEEAQRRIVKAQPILKEDPIPLPEKERKPLTEVQQFVLHVDERAVERSEFDNMIKEKEKTYKRLREENEFAQKIEEEKALKQLRRTMVPHARPLPKFDRPFRPQKSTKEVTRPKSPHLQVDERGARRHAFIR